MALPYQNLPDDPGDPGGGGGGSGGPPAGPSSYGTVIFNRAINKLDAGSALDIIVYLNVYSADDLRFSGYIFVDDTLVQVGTTNATYDEANSRGQGTMTLVAIAEGVSAGAHTVSVRVKNRENEAPLDVLPGSIIKVAELRQAGR